MSETSAIDLSKLSSPDVIETLDFDSIRDAMIEDLITRDADFTALVPSDPAYKIIEVAAYRELLLRSRINTASQSVMLAFASGHDLEHLAALFGVERLLVTAADDTQTPPSEAIWEGDDRLRRRVASSLEGFSTAGPVGAYRHHGLTASAHVKDISVTSPNPGEVLVTVLSTDANGVPDDALLTIVRHALNDESVRPLTDHVVVQTATIVDYTIEAALTIDVGPDPTVVLQAATNTLNAYIHGQHQLGKTITLSALYAALHQPGVSNVNLIHPTSTLAVNAQQAAFCTQITLTETHHD